jgi:hypothetical protein
VVRSVIVPIWCFAETSNAPNKSNYRETSRTSIPQKDEKGLNPF